MVMFHVPSHYVTRHYIVSLCIVSYHIELYCSLLCCNVLCHVALYHIVSQSVSYSIERTQTATQLLTVSVQQLGDIQWWNRINQDDQRRQEVSAALLLSWGSM